ncbi:MAG: 6-carboxytetrahydropterin synthase [Proteobacteria bacterium]|nr:6-carboxytetrahydropterin synthase [Pseudomonadota bacterium]
MLSCTRRIEFDAAHRIVGHAGKCRILHGHRYAIEATFVARNLSEIGMVVDFGIIKSKLGYWIEENWDHNAILNIQDKVLGEKISSCTNQKIYYMNCNPTAENMASILLHDICPKLFQDSQISCSKIKLYETPNCFSECVI